VKLASLIDISKMYN